MNNTHIKSSAAAAGTEDKDAARATGAKTDTVTAAAGKSFISIPVKNALNAA